MNTKNSRLYTKVYRGGVLLAGILLAFSVLSGCKDASDSEGGTAGSGGSGNSSQYTKVAYSDLAGYLASASSSEVNYIEITGTIPAADLKGSFDMSTEVASPSPLGNTLKVSGKKVALKLPETVSGLSSMEYCFANCTDLVSVENIPAGVTNMNGCFVKCTGLTGAPTIPSGVEKMISCFNGCTSLTTAPAVPANITVAFFCFEDCSNLTSATLKCDYATGKLNGIFKNCPALGARSITVPRGQLGSYQGGASDMFIDANRFKEAG